MHSDEEGEGCRQRAVKKHVHILCIHNEHKTPVPSFICIPLRYIHGIFIASINIKQSPCSFNILYEFLPSSYFKSFSVEMHQTVELTVNGIPVFSRLFLQRRCQEGTWMLLYLYC